MKNVLIYWIWLNEESEPRQWFPLCHLSDQISGKTIFERIANLLNIALEQVANSIKVMPLLRRMSIMKKLTLSFRLRRHRSSLLDGIYLSHEALNYLLHLDMFIFDITSDDTIMDVHLKPSWFQTVCWWYPTYVRRTWTRYCLLCWLFSYQSITFDQHLILVQIQVYE